MAAWVSNLGEKCPEGWATDSETRLAERVEIRRVIDDWVFGPVELLAWEDVRELKKILRDDFKKRGGKLRGWQYVCWRAEVRLAIGEDGDATREIKNKGKVRRLSLEGCTAEQLAWFEEMKGAAVRGKVRKLPVQVGIGGLFEI